jgi:hypothetical protein
MAPERPAVCRIHPGDVIAAKNDDLRLAVDVNQDGRRGRDFEAAAFPDEHARLLIERRDGPTRSADRHDDHGVVEERAAAVAAARRGRAVLLDEVVQPERIAECPSPRPRVESFLGPVEQMLPSKVKRNVAAIAFTELGGRVPRS